MYAVARICAKTNTHTLKHTYAHTRASIHAHTHIQERDVHLTCVGVLIIILAFTSLVRVGFGSATFI